MARAQGPSGPALLSAGLFLVLFVLVVLPLLTVLATALLTGVPFAGDTGVQWTAANFFEIWSAELLAAAGNTVVIAIGGTALAMALGGGLAWLYARSDIPLRAFVYFIGTMPLFISLVVASITWTLLASGRSGYLNIILADLGIPLRFDVRSLPGILFVEGLYGAPYPFLFLSAALSMVNPDLEEAAMLHGATLGRSLRRIIFPLVRPALLGSALLVLTLIIEDFPVPEILGGPVGIETVSVRIYNLITAVPPQPNRASAISVLLMLLVCVLVYGQRRLLAGRDVRTVTGKGARARPIRLRALRWPALVLVLAYGTVSVVLPILALVEAALHDLSFIRGSASLVDPAHIQFAPFLAVLDDPTMRQAALNTLIAGGLAALFGTALAVALAYVVERTTWKVRPGLEYLAMVPSAIPAMVLGLGVLWVWVGVPLPVYGTLAVLVIAFITRFLPQGYRAIAATIGQVHQDLEHAAMLSGASRVVAVRRITLPLVRNGIAAAALLILILSFRELTAALFLYTTHTRVLSVVIYEQYQNGAFAGVASASLLYTAFLIVLTTILRRWIGAGL